jgi:hypothetical protein
MIDKEDFGSVVRTGLCLMPYGGALAQWWNECYTKRRFERIEEALAEMREQFKSISNFSAESLTDADYQLLEEILRRVQIEHCEVKRKRFARLLAECWTQGVNETFDKRMLFIRAVDRFDELHVRILKHLEGLSDQEEKYPLPKEIAFLLDVEGPDINESLNPALDLLAREFAFVVRNWTLGGNKGGALLTTGNLSPEGLAANCGCKITSLGRQFIEYISE